MPLAQLNGIDRFYRETGSGDPLLLINGIGGTCLGWEPLLPALAARFRVVASDNRGVGRSAAPPGPYTTRQLADDAAALLAHLGVARAHVVGSSMGGMIAQELALAYPALVDRLVLYGTFARPRRAIMDPWLSFVAQMAERLDPAAAGRGGAGLAGPLPGARPRHRRPDRGRAPPRRAGPAAPDRRADAGAGGGRGRRHAGVLRA